MKFEVINVTPSLAQQWLSLMGKNRALSQSHVKKLAHEMRSGTSLLCSTCSNAVVATEIHCEYCQCPKGIWEKAVHSYSGNECKLYARFLDLVLSDISRSQLVIKTKDVLPQEFPDITDLDATIKELMDIAVDCGLLNEEA